MLPDENLLMSNEFNLYSSLVPQNRSLNKNDFFFMKYFQLSIFRKILQEFLFYFFHFSFISESAYLLFLTLNSNN